MTTAQTQTRELQVTRTYLEMRDISELQRAVSDDPSIRIEEQPDCSVELFRFLYVEVGRNYHWIDRLPWTNQDIVAYLSQPEISLWLMTYNGEPAGYFELRKCEDGSTEIAYFGLLAEAWENTCSPARPSKHGKMARTVSGCIPARSTIRRRCRTT